MSTLDSRDPGSLSRLLQELAEIPRVDLPAEYASGLRPGTRVGRFIIEREIGRGGFGVVYAALDPELGRSVALKLLRPGSGPARKGGEWLQREAEAVARLGHANIVTIHDFGRGPGGAYLVFELLRGETLSARLKRGPLPLAELIKVALAVARAVAHAHAESVLHRDLKPSNVFLCADGAVKVLDFGIAHLFEKDGPSTGGTPAYMAPEQWVEETGDARSDLFAFGVLLHEMLTGTLPYGKAGVGKEAPTLASAVPRDRAPARLRALTAALTQLDPKARPASAHLVVTELEAIEASLRQPRHRALLLGMGTVVLLLGAAGLLLLSLQREPPSSERVIAAIADAENTTGDPDLDRLAEMVTLAMGESRRVQVVSRERLEAAGRAGPSAVTAGGRVDARAGRLLAALAGANVLLVPAASRDGDGFLLRLRGEAPDGGAPLFVATARADGKEGIPAALDRLVTTARRELRERAEDLKGSPVQLAAMTTSSLAAFREYVEGMDCMSHPSGAAGHNGPARCGAFFQRALDQDPSFALAHYQLAYLMSAEGAGQPELRAHMDAALRSQQRLSRRDAAIVLAWKSHLDGRDEEALTGYGRILAEHPDDRQVLFLAGDLLYHRGDWAGAAPYFKRVRELDPEAEWPLEHLARCLAITGRTTDLRELSSDLTRPASPSTSRRLAIKVLVWLGDAPGAVALARQGVAAASSPSAHHDLVAALVAAGQFDEAERITRDLMTGPGDAGQIADRMRLLAILSAQGRFTSAWRLLQEMPRGPGGMGAGEVAYLRVQLAAGSGDLPRLRDATVEAVRLVPEAAGTPLVLLALAGDPSLAQRLGAPLPTSSTSARELEAVVGWRRGQRAEAVATMTQLEQRAPWPEEALNPAFLLAELHADGGEPTEVLAAVERFQRTWPGSVWGGWAWTRALVLSAEASAKLGKLDAARAGVDRALAVLRRADRGLRLLAEARALRDRLGPAGARPNTDPPAR